MAFREFTRRVLDAYWETHPHVDVVRLIEEPDAYVWIYTGREGDDGICVRASGTGIDPRAWIEPVASRLHKPEHVHEIWRNVNMMVPAGL